MSDGVQNYVPGEGKLYYSILKFLSDGKKKSVDDIISEIISVFNLPADILEIKRSNEDKSKLKDKVEKACSNLKEAALIYYPETSTRKIRKKGLEILSNTSDNEEIKKLVNSSMKESIQIAEEYHPGISREAWRSLLNDSTVFNETSNLIVRHLDKTPKGANIEELSKVTGLSLPDCFSAIQSLGERVRNKIDCPLYDNEPSEYWLIPFLGYTCKSNSQNAKIRFVPRPELTEALKETDVETEVTIDFFKMLSDEGLCFETETVENFLLSLKAKPFVILSGGTGTGKTKLAQTYGKYLQLKHKNKNLYKLIPVGSNWTDNRFIIGYRNAITKEYVKTASFELIENACKDNMESIPHMLILDEMNLSHVERYLSDFISCMESGEKIQILPEDAKIDGIENNLEMKGNLFFVGTVNMDETTHTFSPKILDRANVIVIETKSAEKYLKGMNPTCAPKKNLDFLTDCMQDLGCRNFSASVCLDKIKSGHANNVQIVDDLIKIIDDISNQMSLMKLPIGYRTLDEIARFLYVAWIYEGGGEFKTWTHYLDVQIMQKILPKIHGNQSILDPLKDIRKYCKFKQKDFEKSCKKIDSMTAALASQRYISFDS